MAKRKKVSLQEIADAIPCSTATVSLVLQGKCDRYRISAGTQAEILKTAEQMGYVPKGKRQSGKLTGMSITIAVFVGVQDSLPLNDMLKGMSEYRTYGDKRIEYSLHPYELNHIDELEDLFLSKMYDGFIIFPTGKHDCGYLKSLKITTPCVVVTNSVLGYNGVVVDRIECGALAAKLLIAKGHKNIGLVTRCTFSDSGRLRTFGFKSTYEQYGPKDAKITVIEDKTDGDFGLASMNELLETTADDPPTAVFVTEPNNFSGTVNSLRMHGISFPDKMELVVFGNYSDSSINMCLSPSITTISIPVKEMMTDGIDLVCHQVVNGMLHEITKVHHPEICFRDSCTKPDNWDSIS